MKFVLIILLTSLIACGSHLTKSPITGHYYLIRTMGFPEIMYKLGENHFTGLRITEKVAAIGYDKRYIWSMHQEMPNDSPVFYIIPLQEQKPDSPENNKIGPLSESDFKEKMASFGYQELQFSNLESFK